MSIASVSSWRVNGGGATGCRWVGEARSPSTPDSGACRSSTGNSGLPELAPHAQRLLSDPDPVVAEAAGWALARLQPAPA